NINIEMTPTNHQNPEHPRIECPRTTPTLFSSLQLQSQYEWTKISFRNSMPLYFWNDPNNERYVDAYFRFYPNKNVWRRGDYVIFHSDTRGEIHEHKNHCRPYLYARPLTMMVMWLK
ncbi:MAG: hypothetical protein ACUVUE_07995, partial [Candidatus Bathycorpusculaceae bacterium]